MSSYDRRLEKNLHAPKPIHPVWRGFGCLLILLLPVISYAASDLLINYGVKNHWAIPPSLLGRLRAPDIFWKVPGLRPIVSFLYHQVNLPAKLALALLILFILTGLLSLIYATMYRVIGTPKYGPLDAPPIKPKKRRKNMVR
jgi:hypothetical protein